MKTKEKLTPAPIDNKNILEEWDWLTNGEELQRFKNNNNEIFFMRDKILYKLKYQFRSHKFEIECLDSFRDFISNRQSILDAMKIVEENTPNVKIECTCYQASRTYFCAFYFRDED